MEGTVSQYCHDDNNEFSWIGYSNNNGMVLAVSIQFAKTNGRVNGQGLKLIVDL